MMVASHQMKAAPADLNKNKEDNFPIRTPKSRAFSGIARV